MKFSILTATYNRAYTLTNLYDSIVRNNYKNVEWLIMDDGSTDDTKELVDKFRKEKKVDIKYFYQENQGKMAALNNLNKYINSDAAFECDSDDYLVDNFFEIVSKRWKPIEKKDDIYGLILLKVDQNNRVLGNKFKEEGIIAKTFDLYYKLGLEGDKCIIFKGNIRKKYFHKLENGEKFATEGRMHQEMDKNYLGVMAFNDIVMVCEYKDDGYTKNIIKIYKNNPYAHYYYFKEMFDFNMNGVPFKKRLFIIKHYILFSCLTGKSYGNAIYGVKGISNKVLMIMLVVPGYIMTKKKFT